MISSNCSISDSHSTTKFSLHIQRHDLSKTGILWSHESLNRPEGDTSTQMLHLLLDKLNLNYILPTCFTLTASLVNYHVCVFNILTHEVQHCFALKIFPWHFTFPVGQDHTYSTKFLLYLGPGGGYFLLTVKFPTCFLRCFSTHWQNCLHKKLCLGRSCKVCIIYLHTRFYWHPVYFA